MVTYCVGNVSAKRKQFRAAAGAGILSLDNDDVVADFLLDGKVYFVIGSNPCDKLTVREFLAYNRALKTRLPLGEKGSRALLKKVAYRGGLDVRVGRLDSVGYRKVQLAAKLDDDTATVYVNLDGVVYSRRTAARLRAMLRSWGKRWQVYAAVSDYRFVKKGDRSLVYTPEGVLSGLVPQRGKRIARARMHRELKKRGMRFAWNKIRRVVLCDN